MIYLYNPLNGKLQQSYSYEKISKTKKMIENIPHNVSIKDYACTIK
jgi:hypothetical protein